MLKLPIRKENRLGAHPYFYFVKHNPDLNEALAELRQQEFQAGRYNPVIPFPSFPDQSELAFTRSATRLD